MTQADHTLTDSHLSKQLQKLIQNAEKIQSEPFQAFKDELVSKLLWLRPSVGGISAISCCDETPQLGFPKVSIRSLEEILNGELLPPGRKTPEKQLQSWLIQSALKAGGRLKLLDNVLDGQHWFVSDEIALTTASKKKVVADLLLVRVDSGGLASLVNAELKSKRSMETFGQVIRFRDALENPGLRELWKKFAEVMTGQKFQWHTSQETRGVVIWPAVGRNPSNALANEKRKDYPCVEVVGYREIADYTLESEPLPQKS